LFDFYFFLDDEDFEGSGESSGDFDPTCKFIFLVFSTLKFGSQFVIFDF